MKGILFDFNGTMFFDGELHHKAWNAFSKKYRGVEINEEEMAKLHGCTNKEIIKTLLSDGFSDAVCVQMSNEKEKMYRELCLQHPHLFHLVPGLEQFLNKLKAESIPMTICSASIQANIHFFIESFHLERWFDCDKIVYDDGTHINKISMFQKGAENICVPIHKCIVFEDSISGIDFACKCGVEQIIAVTDKKDIIIYKKMKEVNKIIKNFENVTFDEINTNIG